MKRISNSTLWSGLYIRPTTSANYPQCGSPHSAINRGYALSGRQSYS